MRGGRTVVQQRSTGADDAYGLDKFDDIRAGASGAAIASPSSPECRVPPAVRDPPVVRGASNAGPGGMRVRLRPWRSRQRSPARRPARPRDCPNDLSTIPIRSDTASRGGGEPRPAGEAAASRGRALSSSTLSSTSCGEVSIRGSRSVRRRLMTRARVWMASGGSGQCRNSITARPSGRCRSGTRVVSLCQPLSVKAVRA